jgi:hypothetical protein
LMCKVRFFLAKKKISVSKERKGRKKEERKREKRGGAEGRRGVDQQHTHLFLQRRAFSLNGNFTLCRAWRRRRRR